MKDACNRNIDYLRISLTTNGILLPRYIDELKANGLSDVNISLDTLNKDTLEKSCGTGNRVFRSSKREDLKMLPKLAWQREWIFSLAERFANDTKLHDMTSGTHSCILAQKDQFLFSCEDIGRHNAVDKAVGYGLMTGATLSECMLYTSGRVPVDMVEKVISAGIPVLVSKSVPTAESVALAKEYGLTLVCRAHPDRYEIMSTS